MSDRIRRGTAAVVVAALGAGLGGFAGAQWYEAFGPPWGHIGSEGEGLQEILRGALAGGVAGGLSGWFLAGLPRGPGRTIMLLGSVVAAVLLVVGLSFLGDLTNADGPGSIVPYIGFLALPASILLMALLVRLSSRARSGTHMDALARR
ncbi:MAG: hypothetical protein ACRDHO_13165 [Actinomycetota bacterium]